MAEEKIKLDEPRIETPEHGKLGLVFPDRVKEMKERTKEQRAKIAETELFPFNAKDVIAARQAQIDLKEVPTYDEIIAEEEKAEKPKSSKRPKKKK